MPEIVARLRIVTMIAAISALMPADPADALTGDPDVTMPGPASSELSLSYFAGAWDILATTPGSNDVTRYIYEVEPWIRPNWLSGHGRSVPSGEESRDVWGRDGTTGELMRIIFADNGTHAIVRSAGWQGNRLVLEGDARSAGGVVRVRETIERLDHNRFVATWEAFRNGGWSAYSVERVTRSGG